MCVGHSRLLLALCILHGARGVVHADEGVAGTRGPQIFNAVHNAMRQWGSSVHHNGMSILPVTIPTGSLFYHGSDRPERPETMEWLAFEPEHAAGFALSIDEEEEPQSLAPYRTSNFGPSGAAQRVLGSVLPSIPIPPPARGYFHTYRTTRPLKLLYVDGMSAGKGLIGMADTQDLILLNGGREGNDRSDWRRCERICQLGKTWGANGIDGILRMEAGFEIVYCDFQDDGLELASVVGSPFRNETTGESIWSVFGLFEWVRASAQRYDGFELGRVVVDWSAMVSAFWYDGVNVTNSNTSRSELPRLSSSSPEALWTVSQRIAEVFSQNRDASQAIHWQAVTDKIVTQFGPRLDAMIHPSTSARAMRDQVDSIVQPFINYPIAPRDSSRDQAIQQCAARHLVHPLLKTPEDRMISAALEAVTTRICRDLLDVWRRLDPPQEGSVHGAARAAIERLLDWLNWARRRKCRENCEAQGKICFVAMFPLGAAEDHFTPGCRNATEIKIGYFLHLGGGSPAGGNQTLHHVAPTP